VTIVLASGERVRGDVLIGADGIHSVVRRGLGHPCLPRYAGYTAWRGVTWLEQSGLAPEQPFWGVYIGRGAQVGLAPMSEGRVYWFATANTEADGHVGPGGHRADLEQKFGTWAEPVLRILTATPEEAILRNDIVDLPPLRAWGGGCVTLLGDAAHATTPNMGQGACMALEDAVVLARSLSEAAHVSSALRRYEARRVTRTRRVVRQSWTLGRIFQLESPLLCWLRDRMLSLVSPERQLEAMAWLLDYDGTRD
jgi:FAD-dependent urate hydroxylase